MTVRELASVRPDKAGRVVISQALKAVADQLGAHPDAFRVAVSDDGEIILTPIAEIPLRELWLHQNPQAMAMVKTGLEQAARRDFGSFDGLIEENQDD